MGKIKSWVGKSQRLSLAALWHSKSHHPKRPDLWMATHAFVTMHLGYCNIFFMGLPLKNVLDVSMHASGKSWHYSRNTGAVDFALAVLVFQDAITSVGFNL